MAKVNRKTASRSARALTAPEATSSGVSDDLMAEIILPPPPVINSIAPDQLAPGNPTRLTVRGSGLPLKFAYSITTMGGVPVLGVGFQFPTDCAVPPSTTGYTKCVNMLVNTDPGLTPGVYLFRVDSPFGSSVRPIQILGQVTQPPQIDTISPSLINVTQPVQTVTISVAGRNLPTAQNAYSVVGISGSIPATLTFASGTNALLQLTINAAQIPQGLNDFSVCARNSAGVFCRLLQIQNFSKGKEKEKEKEKDKDKEIKEKDREGKTLVKDEFDGSFEFRSGATALGAQGIPADAVESSQGTGRTFISDEERPDVGERALKKGRREDS